MKRNEILTWEYPQAELTQIEGKSSVTKIAKKVQEDEGELKLKKPKFLEGELPLTTSETTVHLLHWKRQNVATR